MYALMTLPCTNVVVGHVARWAADQCRQGAYPERRSELVALAMDQDVWSYLAGEDPLSSLWAIFRARVSDDERETLLLQRFSPEVAPILVQMAHRLDRPSLIEAMLERLPRAAGAQTT